MPGSITTDLHRWRDGDPDAQFDLVRRLQPFLIELLRFVRRHRAQDLQGRIQSEGPVNAALNSFLKGVQNSKFPELQNREQVKKLLTVLVKRALYDEIRRAEAERRNPDREESCDSVQPQHLSEANAMASDIEVWLEKMLAVVRPVHEKAIEIVELSLKGLSNNDISVQTGLSVRWVQVLKKRMRERWESAMAGEG
jgi:DNA-directed RNA polymerase specialized sigma24 family protein